MKNKKKYYFPILLLIFICASIIILGSFALNIREECAFKYLEANALEDSGRYWDAYNKYNEIINWGDSAKRAEQIYPYAAYEYGEKLYYDGNYVESIRFLFDASEGGVDEANDLLYITMVAYIKDQE